MNVVENMPHYCLGRSGMMRDFFNYKKKCKQVVHTAEQHDLGETDVDWD